MRIYQALALAGIIGVAAVGVAQDAPASQPAPAQAQAASAPAESEVVATVDGAKITQADVERELRPYKAQMAQFSPSQQGQFMAMVEQQIMEQLITKRALANYAKTNNITVTDAEIKSELEEISGHMGGPAELEKAVAEQGINKAELNSMVREQLLLEKALEKKQSEMTQPTDEEIQKFFDQHSAQMGEPETVHASHILIGTEKDEDDAAKAEKRKKAEEVLKKINAGEDFAALAKEHSSCPSASQGGDLGTFGRGQMVQPFEEAAFNLEEGKTSGIVETQFGYHIIKVHEHNEGKKPSLDESRKEIVQQLQGPQIQSWIEELRAKADVRYVKAEEGTDAVRPTEMPKANEGQKPADAHGHSHGPNDGHNH